MASGAFTVKLHDRGALTREIRQRAKTFVELEKKERQRVAVLATDESKRGFQRRYRERRSSPDRRHQSMLTQIDWQADPTTGMVKLDVSKLDTKAPHWIIQEIGTNQSATIKRGGTKNPRGRAKAGASYVKTVPSQIGRPIHIGLAFGTGPSGSFRTPDSTRRRQDQIYRRRKLRGAPRLTGGIPPVVIGKEIEGQHFIQRGATAAFREYRPSVRAAAQNAFGGRPRR